MTEDLDRFLAESGLPSEGFDEVRGLLAVLENEPLPEPTPSEELVAMFAVGPVPGPVTGAGSGRRRRAGILVGAVVLGLGGTTAAAAANGLLPERVQEAVADFSDAFLPFQLPHPADRAERRHQPRLEVPAEAPVLSPGEQGEERAPRTPGAGDESSSSDAPSRGPGIPPGSLPSSSPSAPVDVAPDAGQPPVTPGPATSEPGEKPDTSPASPSAPVPGGQPGGQQPGGPPVGGPPTGPGGSGPGPVTAPGGDEVPGNGGTAPGGAPGTTPPDRGLVGGVVDLVLTLPFKLLGA